MPKRRYAIAFLGDGRYHSAIPSLEAIVGDETELDYFRSDALLAISQIDLPRARQLASNLPRSSRILGLAIQAVTDGGAHLKDLVDHDC